MQKVVGACLDTHPPRCYCALMSKPEVRLDLNPSLRYARGVANQILRDFAISDPDARGLHQDRAAALSHLIRQVVCPNLRDGPNAYLEPAFEEIATSMQALAGKTAWESFEFPPDNGQQLILDKLDAILLALQETLHRRQQRHFHVTELNGRGTSEVA